MRRTGTIVVGILAGLLLGRLAGAAGIADYIDDKTAMAIDVDSKRVDLAAVEDWLIATMKASASLEAEDQAQYEHDVHEAFALARRWLGDFQKAGGTSIYVVLDGTKTSGPQSGPVLIAPIGAGANTAALISLFTNGQPTPTTRPRGNDSPWVPQAELLGDKALIFGTSQQRAYARAITPQNRPDFSSAFAAAGDAPGRLAIAPADALRRTAQAELPQNIFGRPTTALTQGVTWISASATVPPAPTARLIIQAKDTATATTINQFIAAGLAMLKLKAQADPNAPKDMDEIIKLLTPTLANDQLRLALDDAACVKLMKLVAPAVRQARQKAMMVQSMSNMRQILVACHMYAAEHQGAWPDDLTSLQKYLKNKMVMSNPRHKDLDPAYVYLKPQHPNIGAAKLPVLYESHTAFGNGVNVGFADGHCEFVASKMRFDELLAAGADNGPGL